MFEDNMNIEENEKNSSLEIELEKLDKNDPEYEGKREKLYERLKELRKDLQRIAKELRKQQKETYQTLKILKGELTLNPDDKRLQNLMDMVTEDNMFLTRAAAEIVAIRGTIKDDLDNIKAQKTFNMPTNLQTITSVKVKPLPSELVEERAEKSKDLPKRRSHNRDMGKTITNLRQSRVVPKVRHTSPIVNERIL